MEVGTITFIFTPEDPEVFRKLLDDMGVAYVEVEYLPTRESEELETEFMAVEDYNDDEWW